MASASSRARAASILPSLFAQLPTIIPRTEGAKEAALCGVIPLPTKSGAPPSAAIRAAKVGSAGAPVARPVRITPSAPPLSTRSR